MNALLPSMLNRPLRRIGCALALAGVLALSGCASPKALPPAEAGSVKGSAAQHTPASLQASVQQAQVALPAGPGAAPWVGRWSAVPASAAATRLPVVVFLHGSSGLGLPAIADWQRWLAQQGIASVAPDSFALPDRITYKSPVDKATYERIHALRAEEAAAALAAVRGAPWADASRIVLAGTSEGAVAVARHAADGLRGRIVYAWSCEDNYMVEAHRTAAASAVPMLNVISTTDPYFSRANAWLGARDAQGHCGGAMSAHKNATIVLIAGAPHTLLMLPAARHATAGFLQDVLK